jgi:type IV pilus assembly protein PilV
VDRLPTACREFAADGDYVSVDRTFINHKSGHTGIGLIEVLIALLVLAVGILGLASMQLAAKRASFEATQRSIATSMARDILERMRSNPGLIDSYEVTNMATATTPGTDCSKVSCDPNGLAEYDLWDWNQMVQGATETTSGGSNAGGLLNSVVCIDNDNGSVTVEIVWQGVNDIVPDISVYDCGAGLSQYTSAAGPNYLRRTLVMTSFIAEP